MIIDIWFTALKCNGHGGSVILEYLTREFDLGILWTRGRYSAEWNVCIGHGKVPHGSHLINWGRPIK